MRIVRAKFGYDTKFNLDEQERIKKAIILPHTEVSFDEEGGFVQWYQDHVVDIDILPLASLKRIEVIGEITHPLIEELHSRANTVVNQKVNVAVPGLGLLAIREVKVRTDLCTEELQRELDDKWMILAICPQPDQRRPDYILGKAHDATNQG